MRHVFTAVCFSIALCFGTIAEEIRIPAFTAYLAPDPSGARVSSSGISDWAQPGQQVLWFGEFTRTGALSCAVEWASPGAAETRLKLTVGDQQATAVPRKKSDGLFEAQFAGLSLRSTGYHRIALQAETPGPALGEMKALTISGEAAQGARFNLMPRRNAASVHLFYPVAKDVQVQAFYCEATAVEDPVHTFYMACGWHRGYFGMQVISPSERRIIFSVWDSGDEAVDRSKVNADNLVQLVGKGQGVYAGDFGNEGTGGHSHLKFSWRTGEVQRFLVVAVPTNQTHTIYSGYYFHPEQQNWMLISSWKAPKDGGWLRGLHSFSENFVGNNGHLRRKAFFGNQWIRTAQGEWVELTTAGFSHDPTGKSDRLDRFMGLEASQFFLSHGGFVPGFTAYGEKFERPARGTPPKVDQVLSSLGLIPSQSP